MDGVQQLDQIIPMLDRLVDGIRPDQLDNATACATFTVTGVLEHMIGGAGGFAPAFRGASAPTGATATEQQSAKDQFHRAMAELLDAVHSPGAQERIIASPFGEVPGAMFARYVALDGLVHGWDMATATGQAYDPPADVVGAVDAYARQLLTSEMRDGDTFAAETEAPAGSNDLVRLVAFTGRNVNWETQP